MPRLIVPFDRDVPGDADKYRCVSSASSMLSIIKAQLAQFRQRSEEMEDEFRYRYNWQGFKGTELAKVLEASLSKSELGWLVDRAPAPPLRLRVMELSYESDREIELAQSAEGLREFIDWYHHRLSTAGEKPLRWDDAQAEIEAQLLAFQVSGLGILPPARGRRRGPPNSHGSGFNWT